MMMVATGSLLVALSQPYLSSATSTSTKTTQCLEDASDRHPHLYEYLDSLKAPEITEELLETLPIYTSAQVKQRDGQRGRPMWVSFAGLVLNVTDFVRLHPGGTARITRAAGQALEPFWYLHQNHFDTELPLKLMMAMVVGRLHEDDQEVIAQRVAEMKRAHDQFRLTVQIVASSTSSTASSSSTAEYSLAQLREEFPKTDAHTHVGCPPTKQPTNNNNNNNNPPTLFAGVRLAELLPHNLQNNTPSLHVNVSFRAMDGEVLEIDTNDFRNILVCYEENGLPLSQKRGYPIRIIIPGKRVIKWVHTLEVRAEQAPKEENQVSSLSAEKRFENSPNSQQPKVAYSTHSQRITTTSPPSRFSSITTLLTFCLMALLGMPAAAAQPLWEPPTTLLQAIHESDDFAICLTNPRLATRYPDIPLCTSSSTDSMRVLEEPPLTEHTNEPAEEDADKDDDETGFRAFVKRIWEESSEEIINAIGALVCISIAALAAGLTLGMLGIDPLLLLIKIRASDDPVERQQAATLLPIVKQHHRLLVTLLLMNAVANEALPIFLEALVPPSLAIVFSVVFVLFFGEIIPSAIFTGPNQMKIASALTPLVKTAMFLLYPIAGPIAKLLDVLLHDEDDHGSAYNRGELSALIRIQYEERLAAKRKRKQERKQHLHSQRVQLMPEDDHIGPLDFANLKSFREDQRGSIRSTKSALIRQKSALADSTRIHSNPSSSVAFGDSMRERSDSIHIDEVTMIEGALTMKVKVALDVFTPMRQVFCIPDSTLLSETGVVKIHASGFSRIPVFKENPQRKKDKTAIVGILLTKQLIVVNPEEKRPVTSMPLYRPLCVGPDTPLVHLVNIFQTGGHAMQGGHLALVCARPSVGNMALESDQPLPEAAGLMGVITLEDVLETILQEQIYDENDVSGEGKETSTLVLLSLIIAISFIVSRNMNAMPIDSQRWSFVDGKDTSRRKRENELP